MPRYLAFLRAINVGGRTVKMERLRQIFAAAGCKNVETYIASGNVGFESGSKSGQTLEKKLAVALQQALGYAVPTFVRSVPELLEMATYKPFREEPEGGGLYIAFLSEPVVTQAQEALLSRQTETDKFHFHGREVYWLCLTRVSDSPFSGPLLEKMIGAPVTVRNSTTVRNIAEKCVPVR